jgi:hypothetical protein
VRAVPGLHQEQFEVIALDSGPPVEFPIPWLGLGGPERETQDEPAATSAPEPGPSEPAPIPREHTPEMPEPAPLAAQAVVAPRSRAMDFEDFSPLDLAEDEPGPAVDGKNRFPILPRPEQEQGEES